MHTFWTPPPSKKKKKLILLPILSKWWLKSFAEMSKAIWECLFLPDTSRFISENIFLRSFLQTWTLTRQGEKAMGKVYTRMLRVALNVSWEDYRQVSNIRRTKSQHLKDYRTVLWLSLPNPLKPDVKSRTKRRQAMLQLHLNDWQFYCLPMCGLY